MRIDSSGRLGVGRSSNFGAKVDVANDGLLCMRICNTQETGHGTHDAQLVAGGTYYQNLKLSGYHITFNTFNGSNFGERARILNGGQLLVGTTQLGTARNDAPVQIATGSSGNSLNLRTRVSDDVYAYLNFTNYAQSNVAASIHIARGSSTNATTLVLSTASSGVNNPTERVHIDSVGNFIISTLLINIFNGCFW